MAEVRAEGIAMVDPKDELTEGGVRIGNVLQRRLPILPWQFDRDAHLRAVSRRGNASALVGDPVVASWDPQLGDAMRREGRRIEEELVADELLRAFDVYVEG